MTHFIHIPGLNLGTRNLLSNLPYNQEVFGNCTVFQGERASRKVRELAQTALASTGIVFWVHDQEALLTSTPAGDCCFCTLEGTPAL